LPEWHARRAYLPVARTLRGAGSGSVLFDPARRRHLAILVSVLLVSIFGFLLLQPRKVHVLADGRDVVIQTNASSNAAVLRGAGISLRSGDRVTTLAAPDGDVLRVERAHDVLLLVDGETYRLRTHARTIQQLLDETQVVTATRDSIVQGGLVVSTTAPVAAGLPGITGGAGREPGAPDTIIEIRRAMAFTIVEDGRESVSTSSRPTVAQALREAGVVVGPGDAAVPAPEARLDADARIEIRHAKPVTVTLPDEHRVLYTLAPTVGEALTASGITIPEGAYTDPSLDTPTTAGMSVRVVQLSASSDEEREYVESNTVYRADSSLGAGQTQTVRGHDGVRVRRYDVAYVNGEEAGRTLIDEYMEPEAVDTVVYYSERRADSAPPSVGVAPPDAPGSSVAGARTLRVYATAYNAASAGRAPSDPAYGRTASGALVAYGIVAVDPEVIPLGTRMYIAGYGYAVAADTGGAVKGYIIDLGYPDGVAIDWTPKWVDIQILS